MITVDAASELEARVRGIDRLPTVPSILRPLLQQMLQPVEKVEVGRLVEMISSDASLAAQCLRMANSALYCRSQRIESVRGAITTLGIARVREILFSCTLVRLAPREQWAINPVAYWEHAFGVALISQRFAQRIGYPDPQKAHLAGLLHDIGVILHTACFHEEFQASAELVFSEGIPLDQAERMTLGFTHEDTGSILARHWNLPEDLCEVIGCHHDVQQSRVNPALTAIVSLSDLLCRMRGMGYGYYEPRQVDFLCDPAWTILAGRYPEVAGLDVARFCFEMDEYAPEVRALVGTVFGR